MNIGLALKIEHVLGIEEGFFMILQVYYDIEQKKKKQNSTQPNLSIIRTVLFWDTNMKKIDWQKQKKAIIKRIFERGNEIEKTIFQDKEWRYYGNSDNNRTSDPNRVHIRKIDDRNIFQDVENMKFSDKIVSLAIQIYIKVIKGSI